jgi:uncharacterized membrane-anchored protein
MNAAALEHIRHQAMSEGVLPPEARLPAQDARPWPVVLLTALGAWLAAVPLIGVVSLLLGDLALRHAGPYVIGALVLAASVVVLRARDLPLFVEQLAVPALLVGGATLGFGLSRDLHMRAGSLILAAVALGLAIAIAKPWLRAALGAAGACLLAVAATPDSSRWFGRDSVAVFWWAWHAVLMLWVAGLVGQAHVAASRPRVAAALEPLLAGALLATLGALAWWSGTSFLVGASLGEPGRELAGLMSLRERSDAALHAGSAVLAAAAAAWLAWRWPSVRRAWCAGVAAGVVLLAWFMPALGATCLALAACAASGRWRLAAASATTAVWGLGSFYYRLEWPLQTKALVLLGAAAWLGALAWGSSLHRPRDQASPARAVSVALRPARQIGVLLGALAALVVVNQGIWVKERLIRDGAPVYLELAPVDPRSLMQGDFMRLNVRLPAQVETGVTQRLWGARPRVVAHRDARGVATLVRLDDGSPLSNDELHIELTPKDGRWIVVSDAWFFREGEAERWSRARYAEFRVMPDGRALLVGLRGAELEAL